MNPGTQLIVPVRTLTPLWTGDIARNSSIARPTGILGSMRAWYEAIVRGMGGTACDPTNQPCRFDAHAYAEAYAKGWRGPDLLARANLCPACQLFGATGWQRRFRLTTAGFRPLAAYFTASDDMAEAAGHWLWTAFGGATTGGTKTVVRSPERRAPDNHTRPAENKATHYTFGVKCLWGAPAQLQFTALELDADGVLARIAYLLDVMGSYGALGAKSQNGFGQFIPMGVKDRFEQGRRLVARDVAASQPFAAGIAKPAGAFSLRGFFCYRYELNAAEVESYKRDLRNLGETPEDHSLFIPCSYDIRYKSVMGNPETGAGAYGMRPWFRRTWGKAAAQQLLGATEGARSASRIHVSHIFRLTAQHPWQLKVWCHVPASIVSDDGTLRGANDAAKTVRDFIAGPDGMFPHSTLAMGFKASEVL